MVKTKKKFTNKDYNSGDGMLTRIWGPPFWHVLHTISFNYPINPKQIQKKKYRDFILNLQHILPCKYCRDNLKKNLKKHPLQMKHLKNRNSFSKWMYDLHEIINTMLNKKSNLSYEEIRDRYEHFRSRCNKKSTTKNQKCRAKKTKKTKKKKENGCITPLKGKKKSKCIIKIVPFDKKERTFQIDKKCTL